MDDSPIQTALCVIGHPIGGNPTQFVASRALAALGLEWQFVSFDVEPSQIEQAIRGVDSLGFCGAMIASPYQTKVAAILAEVQNRVQEASSVSADDTLGEPIEPTWFDCLIRNQGKMVAHNLYAESFQSLIESHGVRTGHPLGCCLLLREPQKLDEFILPVKQVLPPHRFCAVGNTLSRWPAQPPMPNETQTAEAAELRQVTAVSEPAAVLETTVLAESMGSPVPQSLAEEPWLILWGLDAKPRKKTSSKSPPSLPSATVVAEWLGQLHPGSLLVDLTGTSGSWLEGLHNEIGSSISVVTTLDLELLRLATAIKRWTRTEPNLELMREAIEEYLEV